MQEKLQYALDLCNKNKFNEALPVLEEITNGADKAGGPAYYTMPEITRKSVQAGLLVRMQPFMVND